MMTRCLRLSLRSRTPSAVGTASAMISSAVTTTPAVAASPPALFSLPPPTASAFTTTLSSATFVFTARTIDHSDIRRQVTLAVNLSLENPYFNTNLTVYGLCFRDRIIDVGAKRVQGNPAFLVLFGAGHICPRQTA